MLIIQTSHLSLSDITFKFFKMLINFIKFKKNQITNKVLRINILNEWKLGDQNTVISFF